MVPRAQGSAGRAAERRRPDQVQELGVLLGETGCEDETPMSTAVRLAQSNGVAGGGDRLSRHVRPQDPCVRIDDDGAHGHGIEGGLGG